MGHSSSSLVSLSGSIIKLPWLCIGTACSLPTGWLYWYDLTRFLGIKPQEPNKQYHIATQTRYCHQWVLTSPRCNKSPRELLITTSVVHKALAGRLNHGKLFGCKDVFIMLSSMQVGRIGTARALPDETQQFLSQSSQRNDLLNWYALFPSIFLSISRIEDRLVSLVSGLDPSPVNRMTFFSSFKLYTAYQG